MYDAFILAAGFGTRLRPLTDELPKPLVPVCGVPMLAYALAQCAHFGIKSVVVNAHWKAEQLVSWSGLREGCQVSISEELPEILGTGGGLHRVREVAVPWWLRGVLLLPGEGGTGQLERRALYAHPGPEAPERATGA